jgi:hypothetical protein
MKLDPKILRVSVVLLPLALLMAASCSETADTGDTTTSEKAAASTEKATADKASPEAPSAPDPVFDSLLPTLQQMTTAPIMLPTFLPPKVGSVAIEQDPNENPYTTGGDRYTILFLHPGVDPSQIVRPYVHYMTLGRLTASPVSTPELDPTNGLGTPYQLESVTLPDGTVADLKRLEPPQGANYGPFTVGTFEEGGVRYTVLIENDSPEGDVARQIFSTMVKVPST